MAEATLPVDPAQLLGAISDGVYVTDRDRRILYWSPGAERITGWKSGEVVGRCCRDNILCHVDKHGRAMCGAERCPLHRAIVTGEQTTAPVIIFGKGRDGRRIPMQTSVAPVRGADGEIVGGIEVFRDLTLLVADLERARRIQQSMIHRALPHDPAISIRTHYAPCDLVGGDFCATEALGDGTYALLLADVMGHGVASALYTIALRTIWDEARAHLDSPARTLEEINRRLRAVTGTEDSFATALCARIDPPGRRMVFAGAGQTPPLLYRHGAPPRTLDCSGLPLGILPDARYEDAEVGLEPGDVMLCYTDGAIEVTDAAGRELGEDGLIRLLAEAGYPDKPLVMNHLETAILRFSNSVTLPDDLTFVEILIGHGGSDLD
jgi:PAS domain S-box-containing protein